MQKLIKNLKILDILIKALTELDGSYAEFIGSYKGTVGFGIAYGGWERLYGLIIRDTFSLL